MFIVMQVTTDHDGKVTPAIYTRDTQELAMKLFYQKCAADVDNASNANALDMVIMDNGTVLAEQHFEHSGE